MAASDTTGITKEFLEKVLSLPVEKFKIKPGSYLGDGYTCVLHSVAVSIKNGDKDSPLNIVIKCFPSSAARQEFLESTNIFGQELGVYQEVIPELVRFQEDFPESKRVTPPFAGFYYGIYVDEDAKKKLGRPLHPLDNCIIMPDLRTAENGSYRLRDRFLGFDLQHYSLVIEAQARLHAMSWAYKCKTSTPQLEKRFPFLDISKSYDAFKGMPALVHSMYESTREMFPDREDIVAALNFLEPLYLPIMGLYFTESMMEPGDKIYTKDNITKVPVPTNPDEEPWLVLLHGDAWSNNMMFRYDEKTGKPVEVLLVDLQMTREGDPFCDMQYTLYSCTSREFRKKHLNSMLHLYYDTFLNVCKRLDVPPLPGFTWEEFKRRFHRSKIFGACMATMILRVILKNPEDLVDLDNIKLEGNLDVAANMEQFFESIVESKGTNPLLVSRIGAVLSEMIDEGVI